VVEIAHSRTQSVWQNPMEILVKKGKMERTDQTSTGRRFDFFGRKEPNAEKRGDTPVHFLSLGPPGKLTDPKILNTTTGGGGGRGEKKKIDQNLEEGKKGKVWSKK